MAVMTATPLAGTSTVSDVACSKHGDMAGQIRLTLAFYVIVVSAAHGHAYAYLAGSIVGADQRKDVAESQQRLVELGDPGGLDWGEIDCEAEAVGATVG